MRSTYLAPNAVLDLISASTLLGRYWNGPGYIFSFSFEESQPPDSAPMDATSPTWTPRNFTFAPFSMTRPALSETRVSGTKLAQRPGEQQGGQRGQRRDHHEQHRCPPDGIDLSAPGCVCPFRHPDRWKLPDCPYTDSVMVNRMKTPAVIEVRTARPTASPTPAGPPVAVYP